MSPASVSETFDACTVAHFSELLRKLNASEDDTCYVGHKLAKVIWVYARKTCQEAVEAKIRQGLAGPSESQKTLPEPEGTRHSTAPKQQSRQTIADKSIGEENAAEPEAEDKVEALVETLVDTFFKNRQTALALTLRHILLSRYTHGVNIHDDIQADVGKKVLELATMNRLPEKKS